MLEGATAHAILPALDIDRAKSFYKDKVGATPQEDSPSGTFFSIGETSFSIYPTPNPTRGGHTQMGIRVDDVGSAVKELRDRGVTFEEYDMPGLKTVDGVADLGDVGKGAWFKDSEDNIIGVVQFNL
ncbi:MAG TPA: VOC family protein [Candidatus Dormibacteraeota bacterium]|jgi:predicted enzyme related to lactoylglutathione lyase